MKLNVKLLPTEWLKELVLEFQKHEHFKNIPNVELLDSIDVMDFLEDYEKGYTPKECVENEFELINEI